MTEVQKIRKEVESILNYMDFLQEKPISEDLEEAAKDYSWAINKQVEYIKKEITTDAEITEIDIKNAYITGAKWQKENLWKPADGDDLPEIDREVIVLTQPYPLEKSEYEVSFAHRPNPNGWNGKSLSTGKVEHYTPETYGKGNWNIPNVKYWLDVELPKE